jgi:protein-S-isoprenylcysteine O-methyltransferase Ste14
MRRSRGDTRIVLYVRASMALVLPVTVDVVVPTVLVRATHSSVAWHLGGLGGAGLALAGLVLLLDCVFRRFAREGRGTLAPIDPPRLLVHRGPYAVVRNPMYIANVAIVAGTGIAFRSVGVLAWGAATAVAFHVFVVGYEEPVLRRRFGVAYANYCDDVGRWLPRR